MRLPRLSGKTLDDTVNRQRLLRILILADVFSTVAGVIAAIIFEETLPDPLRTYAAAEEFHPFLLIAGLLLLILQVVAWVGLWRSAPWAPAVYAIMWVSCVVVVPFFGPYVGTGIEEMFDFVGTAAGGGILALLLLAMDERRRSGTVILEGADATSGPLSAIDHPHHSEMVVQPNIKSCRVHRVLSALYGLIAVMLSALPYVARTEGLRSADVALVSLVPLFFLSLATFHFFVSRGAKQRKRWARIGSIILACSLLPGVPVGTIIGVYLLRNSSWNQDSGAASGD